MNCFFHIMSQFLTRQLYRYQGRKTILPYFVFLDRQQNDIQDRKANKHAVCQANNFPLKAEKPEGYAMICRLYCSDMIAN